MPFWRSDVRRPLTYPREAGTGILRDSFIGQLRGSRPGWWAFLLCGFLRVRWSPRFSWPEGSCCPVKSSAKRRCSKKQPNTSVLVFVLFALPSVCLNLIFFNPFYFFLLCSSLKDLSPIVLSVEYLVPQQAALFGKFRKSALL